MSDTNGWSKSEKEVMYRLEELTNGMSDVATELQELKLEVVKLQVKTHTRQYMWAGIFGALPATAAFLYVIVTKG